ncbi:peroxiredoxin-like family protein [Flectobacillus major]|uniref:peroxiredoxin-like family protein n=1 Tax=Flectobacillus major TaxID=103 RepID=UPI0003FFEED3|nr:peroxiredoxin-like family protein [Flectobacillus major]
MKFLFLMCLTISSLLVKAQGEPQALKVGQQAPALSGNDHKGNSISLPKLLAKGKVVVMFYRGAWCPYCNKYMSQLEEALPEFEKKGVRVIAITPEPEEAIGKAVEKTKASFSIIYDKDRQIMKDWNVLYTMTTPNQQKYKGYGLDLAKIQGDWQLPVPATYVIDQSGKITFVHFDENYKERAAIKDILGSL